MSLITFTMPEHAFEFKGVNCHGGKKSKDQLITLTATHNVVFSLPFCVFNYLKCNNIINVISRSRNLIHRDFTLSVCVCVCV